MLEIAFPSGVLGPCDLGPLLRAASICAWVCMRTFLGVRESGVKELGSPVHKLVRHFLGGVGWVGKLLMD